MTSCTASFQETSANVGDIIHADFTWADAVKHYAYLWYSIMWIEDPNGNTHAIFSNFLDATGSQTLEFETDMAGTWKCQIDVWQGVYAVHCTDTVTVSGPDTSCTASFQETSANVGDTIHADFTWSNGQKNPDTFSYAIMFIRDPNETNCDTYAAWTEPSGSKTLSCVTYMAGTWKVLISVWNGFMWIECTATVTVSEGDFTLDEALTCEWVNGYNDHGPMVTEFDIGQVVYAYSEIHGPDIYGHTVRHEWWYKATGESEFTWRWESERTCGSHYTEWARWTWWEIGGAYGPGEGYIKVYFDDIYLGKTNNYTIIAPVIGKIHENSIFHTGPFQGGTNSRVIDLYVQNIGAEPGQLNIYIYEYPNNQGGTENQIAPLGIGVVQPGGVEYIPINLDIPLMSGTWPLGIKVWGDGESEPPWGSMQTKIFKIHNQLLPR